MPPLVLAIHPDPRSLLEMAADAAHGYRMDGILLALRQGGIRDDLYRLAGAAGHPGWFDPPACTFKELRDRLGGTDRVPLSPDERLVLLERLVRQHGGAVFGQLKRRLEFLDPIDTLIGELVAADVTPAAFHASVAAAQTHEPWDHDRNRALAAIYQAWHDTLDTGTPPRRDGRDDLIDLARHIADHPDALSTRLAGRTELRIVGLADLGKGWRTLLQALRTCPVFSRITIHALNRHLIDVEGLECDEITGEPASADTLPRPTVIQAPDTDREVEEVAVRVRRLLDQGVPAHRIAVVSRSARPHLELVLAALGRLGAPATARRRIGYRQIPAVRGVLAVFHAAAEGWTRHGLAELASHPAMASELEGPVIDLIGFRRATAGLAQWREAFDALVVEATGRQEEDDDEHRGWIPTPERATQARDRFAAFADRAAALDASRPLTGWIGWLDDLLINDPWQMMARIRQLPDGEHEVARVDLAGWAGLTTAIGAWRRALAEWSGDDHPLDVASFVARLATVLRGDATLWTSCRRGVQVTEALGAAYRHFDHLFVVGLETGAFPARPPRSPILHREDRASLRHAGLPLDLDASWEARERSLFHALRTGGTQVTLSHAALDSAGREVVPSVFLDEISRLGTDEISPRRVLTPGMPLVPDIATARHALANSQIELLRATGQPSPWNGVITDPALRAWLAERHGEQYMWSPTQLEGFAKCPWSWFSSRVLKLEEQAEPEAEMDPTVRGTLWHAALEIFWKQAMERLHRDGRSAEALMLRASDLAWAEPLLDAALSAAWVAQDAASWMGEPALHATTRAQLGATLLEYLRWEVSHNEDALGNARTKAFKQLRTAVAAHELRFRGIVLERNGIRFQYRGSIDRVEVGVDERVTDADRYVAAVDYKSSTYSTPGGGKTKAWDEGVVLQVPLYAHAIAQLEGKEVARAEYRSIRQQETAHTLALVKFEGNKKSGYELTADDDAAEKMSAALDAAAAHVARVRQGEYPAQTVESCKCPSFCHAWDICRIAGGPQSSW